MERVTDREKKIAKMITPLHLLIVLAVTSSSLAEPLQYKCFPNNTIIVTNPSPETYTSILADNSVVTCTTVWRDENRTLAEITGCTKDNEIHVSFMNRPLVDDMIIGGNMAEHFIIHCAEISLDGVERRVMNGITAYVSSNKVASVTPSFRVHTQIYSDSNRTVIVKRASVGTQLYWTIEGPSEYQLMPLTCKAFSGPTVGGVMSKDITVNGCSENEDLVGDFRVTGPGELGAAMFAFRFFNSPDVNFQCVVRVCPDNSDICNFNCSSRNKRESLPVADDPSIQQQFVTTHLSVISAEDANFELSMDVSSVTSVAPSICTMMFIIAVQVLQFGGEESST